MTISDGILSRKTQPIGNSLGASNRQPRLESFKIQVNLSRKILTHFIKNKVSIDIINENFLQDNIFPVTFFSFIEIRIIN